MKRGTPACFTIFLDLSPTPLPSLSISPFSLFITPSLTHLVWGAEVLHRIVSLQPDRLAVLKETGTQYQIESQSLKRQAHNIR